jgi:(E)-4-hydroxy-3-methylbut-2-enyl-diphosphate synthase
MRKKTIAVQIGNIQIGGTNPVAVQAMTNTPTADVNATYKQIVELITAGAELVRIAVNDLEAAKAVPEIKEKLLKAGYQTPLIGDFHYNGHTLLSGNPKCAKALDKYRINPGNIGLNKENFQRIIEIAKKYNKPVRIGVNVGSLDQKLLEKMVSQNAKSRRPIASGEVLCRAMVSSALNSAGQAQKYGLPKNKIVLSVKMSDLQDTVSAYQQLTDQCDYPLHLGLTEAGGGLKGIVGSAAALAILLQNGIGDTIRVSITPRQGQSRTEEVKICREILQALDLRQFSPKVISCPGCGRTKTDLFQKIAGQVEQYISKRLPVWKKKYRGVEALKVAVMGCVVNGPGESRNADIGISLPGKTEKPIAFVYINGRQSAALKGGKIAPEFLQILEKYISSRFS